MVDFFDNWSKQVRKGLLEYCILLALRHGDLYGYALVKQIAAVRGLEVAEGTIYPLLSRLKKQGLLETMLRESPDGPARKYYHLTDEGVEALEMMGSYFSSMVEGINDLKNNKK